MTERQEKYKTATPVATVLPEEYRQRAEALSGQKKLWRERGALVLDGIEELGKKKKTLLYQDLSDIWDCGVSTVREDMALARDFGQWCDEMPYDISRIRIRRIKTLASLRGIDVLEVLVEDSKSIDKYGKPCPIRVYDAKIKEMRDGKRDEGNPVVARLSAGTLAWATALKRSVRPGEPCAPLAPKIEALLNTAEQILEEAETLVSGNGNGHEPQTVTKGKA